MSFLCSTFRLYVGLFDPSVNNSYKTVPNGENVCKIVVCKWSSDVCKEAKNAKIQTIKCFVFAKIQINSIKMGCQIFSGSPVNVSML